MSNLAQSQANWTAFAREEGFFLSSVKCLDDVLRRFDASRNRVQIVEQNSVNGFTSAWTLAGAVYGTNTDETGTLYVRIAKDAFATTVAAGSNGVNVNTFVGAQTLNVASTTGFPAAGTLTVATGSGNVVVTYTAVGSSTTFTGCSCPGAGVLATSGAVSASTVNLYTAAGASGLVATGTGAYPASGTNTLTLLAQNSSGLTGTVALTTLTGSETNDQHRLLVMIDFPLRARSVFNGSDPTHGTILSAAFAAMAQCVVNLQACRAQMQGALDVWFGTRGANFLGSSAGTTFQANTTNTQGLVSTFFRGYLEDQRSDMVDELTAGAQKVVKNVTTATAPVADSHNTGQGTATTPTLNEWARTGTLTLQCNSNVIGSETFIVSQRIAATNEVVTAEELLQVKRAFASPALGVVNMLLSRTMLISPGLAVNFGTVASWTVNGEAPGNTNGGAIYMRVRVNPSAGTQFLLEGWTTSTLATGTQVFQTDYGLANATVNINAIGGSGLSGLAVLGSAPVDLATGTLNLQCFVAQGSVPPGAADKFTCAITRTSSGEWQDKLGDLYRYGLNSVAAGSQTLSEGLVSAGSIVPYSVRDA